MSFKKTSADIAAPLNSSQMLLFSGQVSVGQVSVVQVFSWQEFSGQEFSGQVHVVMGNSKVFVYTPVPR